MFPELKQCQICNFSTFLTFTNNKDQQFCALCNKEVIKFKLDECENPDTEIFYCYCETCNFLFRFNTANIHHQLNYSGIIYFAEFINKYTIKGNPEINSMPTFSNMDKCMYLIAEKIIKFNWISFLNNNDECCVCFEHTVSSTECAHKLCVSCYENIGNKCPICRKEQIFCKKIINTNHKQSHSSRYPIDNDLGEQNDSDDDTVYEEVYTDEIEERERNTYSRFSQYNDTDY